MTRKPLDDEDDDTTAQLTHIPRGRDVLEEHMRAALHQVQAAKFVLSPAQKKERNAVEGVEQSLLNAFVDLGISLHG